MKRRNWTKRDQPLRARTCSDPAEWPDDLRRFAEKEELPHA